MPTLQETIESIARSVGWPTARLRTLARKLQDADVLPSGAPGVPPNLEPADVLALIIAAASGTTLRRAAQAVAAYLALPPGGADLSTAPATVQRTAGAQLAVIARLAMDGDHAMRRLKIEVCRNWPEVAIHHPDGSVVRFLSPGALPGNWSATGHRSAVEINGAAFADVFIELFEGSKK